MYWCRVHMCTDCVISPFPAPLFNQKHWEILPMMSFSGTYLMKECSDIYLVTVISGLSLSDPFTLSCMFVFLLGYERTVCKSYIDVIKIYPVFVHCIKLCPFRKGSKNQYTVFSPGENKASQRGPRKPKRDVRA